MRAWVCKTVWNDRGSIFVTSVILSLLFFSLILIFHNWSSSQSNRVVRQLASEKAMANAESGIDDLMLQTRGPSVLPINSTQTISVPLAGGRYEVAVRRNFADSDLVEAFSTGYYYLPKGAFVDPLNGSAAQIGVVHVKLRVNNASEFLAAVPTTLNISYGSQIATGKIYARDLAFGSQGGNPYNPTQIAAAYYFNSVSNATLPDVIFTQSPANAQQLSYPLGLPTLDGNMQTYYFQKASGPGQVLDATVPFAGTQSAPTDPNPHVYYCSGALHLGTPGQALNVSGVYVIYVASDVYIDNNIIVNPGSWLGVLSEQNIHLSVNAPDALTIFGTYVANGSIEADGPARPAGATLSLNGGFVANQTLNFSTVWTGAGSRSYTYQTSTDPHLLLPNVTTQLSYEITHGKYD